MTAPEMTIALYNVLIDLRRDLTSTREVQKDTLHVLRDIVRELEYFRTERERMARIDRLLIQIDERQKKDTRLEEMLDAVTAGKVPPVRGPAAVIDDERPEPTVSDDERSEPTVSDVTVTRTA